MDHAARGKKALEVSNYEEAIKEYTAALKLSPTSPDYYIQRATAHQRSKNYTQALSDANHGVVNARNRAKKELIIEGQFRRGCALWSLGRYGDAQYVLALVKKMKDDHKMADMWINKTALSLKDLPEDDERRLCKVEEVPDLGEVDSKAPVAPKTTQVNAPVPVVATPKDKIRHEWYQNTQNVYFTLMAKGVPKEKAQFDITERSVTISFPTPDGASYDLTLDPLFADVKPADCISRVLPSKVEVVLAKAIPGKKWSALESSEPVAEKVAIEEPGKENAVHRAVFTDSKPNGPAYPTSSRNGPKNWEKFEAENDEDEIVGDAADHFFKKLFKDASPEVQRAMMKSYSESNGTSLSTNWDEVSKGKVETLPPTGMEAKKW